MATYIIMSIFKTDTVVPGGEATYIVYSKTPIH